MKKIYKYRYEIIIFVIDAIAMILELIASRVLSPYFGSSNLVWTSVIGIILLSSSLGNYLGGKIADNKGRDENLKIILALSAVFIFIIPFFQEFIINIIKNLISDIKIGAIISTISLFFIPSLFIGTITPVILKSKINDLETTGKSVGNITAIATIGGIFGTFLGGFFLIPNFGSIQILFVLAIITTLLIFIVDFKFEKKYFIYCICLICASVIALYFVNFENNNNAEAVLDGENDIIASFDTQYGRVWIYNKETTSGNVRVLDIDSGYESITYTDEDKQNELYSKYTKAYDLMFNSKIEINNTLMIGGAGYSYPKYYISHFLDKNMDVVEIDGEITEIAKKYFYLDKLIDDYNLNENKRLNLIEADGRTYLNNNTKKYDAILNDAFSGSSPAKTLTTLEAIQKIKSSLNENGLYLTNIISALEGDDSKFIKAEVNTLKQVFKNVYVIPCNENYKVDQYMNNMVIATDDELTFDNEYEIDIDESEIVLTDNYCPVDTLIPIL